jgi:hypothetical protein
MAEIHNNNDLDLYYRQLAMSTAKNLNKLIRHANGVSEDPQLGSSLYEMPVYEPINNILKSSLHSHTNTIIPTKLTVVSQSPVYVDAYFRKYVDLAGNETASIVVTDLNPCWTRFFVSKELMHCYIHETGDATSTSSDLRDLIISKINETGTSSNTAQSIVDDVAYFGAVEYLIPSDTVPLLKAVYDVLSKNPATQEKAYLNLATKIRVPESILEFRLNNDHLFEI